MWMKRNKKKANEIKIIPHQDQQSTQRWFAEYEGGTSFHSRSKNDMQSQFVGSGESNAKTKVSEQVIVWGIEHEQQQKEYLQ